MPAIKAKTSFLASLNFGVKHHQISLRILRGAQLIRNAKKADPNADKLPYRHQPVIEFDGVAK